MFKKLFKFNKPHFLYRKKKSSALVFSDTLIQFANEDITATIDTVLEYIPEDELFTVHKNIKPLGLLSLSYHIACFLNSAIVNAQLSDEVVAEMKAHLLKQILAVKNENGAIWSESDIALFDLEITNHLVSIAKFNAESTAGSKAIEDTENTIATNSPGDSLIDAIIKHYELSCELLSSIDKETFANKLNKSIKPALSAFDDGALKWVNG